MLRNHNPKGLEILYNNYSSALYGIIHRIIKDDVIAEDVLQEIFIKIWNNINQYDKEKGRLFTWLIYICRNVTIDKLHSKEFINQTKNQDITKTSTSSYKMIVESFNLDTIGIKDLVLNFNPEYRTIINLLFLKAIHSQKLQKH